jgi:hypothetical protein
MGLPLEELALSSFLVTAMNSAAGMPGNITAEKTPARVIKKVKTANNPRRTIPRASAAVRESPGTRHMGAFLPLRPRAAARNSSLPMEKVIIVGSGCSG